MGNEPEENKGDQDQQPKESITVHGRLELPYLI